MDLAQGITQAYDRQWSMINTFSVQINLPTGITETFTDDINLNIISLNTPDFTNNPIEAFIANKWYIHNGRDELYRFSITFRDQNQLDIYKTFLKVYEYTKNNYFDDCKMSIVLTKDADWYNEDDVILMELNDTLVESVSNLAFSNNTENQIAEFSVNFKCTTPNINN